MSVYRSLGLLLCLFLLAACSNGMEDQPKYESLEASAFFENGMSARPLVPNTVARGQLNEDSLLYAGQVDGAPAQEFPFPITAEVLARGQERYNIYCTPCHGYAGYGDGVVAQRGLTPPPSFHSERLRMLPVGHIFDVITNGIGTMYSYGDRVAPEDRWAIIAYVQALQLSQNATLDDVPPEVQPTLQAATEVVTESVPAVESEEESD
jgi:mono/diheme cytochrome c family protein